MRGSKESYNKYRIYKKKIINNKYIKQEQISERENYRKIRKTSTNYRQKEENK
jgi:hypothetical protein